MKQTDIQNNLNKANVLINKALKTNPVKPSLLNLAIGHLVSTVSILESKSNSAKVKEQESIIKPTKDKGLENTNSSNNTNGDIFEEHY